MRNFNTRFRLLDTDRQIRLVYTFFVSIVGIGFALTLYWAYTMNGLSYDGVITHYLGSDATFGEPKSFHELAEITHFHLFTMPIVFLIIVHIFFLTMAPRWLKITMAYMSFTGVGLDLLSPWLILYVSEVFALTLLLGDFFMISSFVLMSTLPLYEMWILKRRLIANED
ncbi:MAG: hypothetical protein CMH81_02150 [Nitrospiraceae bacterium]|nr:hypothetical protein [Nitrospiraceae bacterium]